jgi:hypothetical protein
MTKMKSKLNIILIIALLFVSTTGAAFATSDGKGNRYIRKNVGIKVTPGTPLGAQLVINGSMIMNDGNENTDYIMVSDVNGLGSWVPASSIPGILTHNGHVNHISVFNGFLQDAYLNGTTTIDGKLFFEGGYTNGHIYTMMANGNAHWLPNTGSSGSTTNGEWTETAGVLHPSDSNGAQNVVIGAETLADADIILFKNGAAQFNRQLNPDADFNISSNGEVNMFYMNADEDQIGIAQSDPDVTLDVNGHFSIRVGTAGASSPDTAFTSVPDNDTAVFWLADGTSIGDNGDLMARINNGVEDKVFTVIDFDGVDGNGDTTKNGIILTDLTPNRLVRTDADKRLVSETNIIVDANGYVAVGGHTVADSLVEVGDGIRDFIDGVNDLHVADDIEADGTVYGANFVGDGSGLELNGNTIRNARIFSSRIYRFLDFNGASMIRAGFGPLLVNGDTEFAGDAIMQSGYIFKILDGAPGSEYSTFYAHNGQIGINTENPGALFDINGQMMIRGGSPAAGYVLTSDNNGLASWQFIDSNNASYAINAGNATTANFADAMNGGTIINSTFLGGVINGSTLVNVTIASGTGISEWTDGVDGLHPRDAGGVQNVLVGGSTLAGSTITLETNGTVTAVKYRGDGSEITGAGTDVWVDQGTFLHPGDLGGAETVVIGGTTVAAADIILGDTGYVVLNEQGLDSDFRVEGQAHDHLFFTDASTDRVGIKTSSPRTDFDVNGSIAMMPHTYDASAAGIPGAAINDASTIYLRNSGNACLVDITASPQIPAGVDGQIITLVGLYTNEAVLLEDGAGLALNNNVSFTLRAKDTITFVYSSAFGEWVEVTRNNYTERVAESITRGACI